MKMRIGIAVALWLLSGALQAAPTPEAVQACLRANLPQRNVSQTMDVASFRGSGGERELRAELYAAQPQPGEFALMIEMLAPVDVSGARYLVLQEAGEEQVFVYLPALRRVRRIVGSQQGEALWGTDFSYADLKQIQGILSETPAEYLPTSAADQAGLHRFALTPPAATQSPYSRIEMDVDATSCLPTQVLFFDAAGVVFKRLSSDASSFARQDERWVYTQLKMENLRQGTHTIVSLSKVRYDERISPAMFRPNSFHFGR